MTHNTFGEGSCTSKENQKVTLTALEAAVLVRGALSRLKDDLNDGIELEPRARAALGSLVAALSQGTERPASLTLDPWQRSLLAECVLMDEDDPLAGGLRDYVQEKLIPEQRQPE